MVQGTIGISDSTFCGGHFFRHCIECQSIAHRAARRHDLKGKPFSLLKNVAWDQNNVPGLACAIGLSQQFRYIYDFLLCFSSILTILVILNDCHWIVFLFCWGRWMRRLWAILIFGVLVNAMKGVISSNLINCIYQLQWEQQLWGENDQRHCGRR